MLATSTLHRHPTSQYTTSYVLISAFHIQSGTEKMDCHGVCEHSVCKLLLNNGFIIVERRLPKIGYGDDKE